MIASRSPAPTSKRLRGFLADVGPGLAQLPWSSPAEAESWSGARDRARLARLKERAQRSWLHPEPHLELAAALAEMALDDAIALYPGAPPGGTRWFAQTFGDRTRPSDASIVNHHVLPEVRLYEIDRRDPFAGRPVACGPLFAGATTGNDPLGFVERILEANGLRDQLRMVLYERGAIALFAGCFRERGKSRFGEREHALLLAARPALRTWSRTALAIGVRPLGDGVLVAVLNALDRPALLLRRGRVVFANAPGAALADRILAWHRAGRPCGVASTTTLHPSGIEVELVLPAVEPCHRAQDPLEALPPSLRRVADLVALGLADKEISAQLEIPLTTARTYVARALQQLGLRGRRELMLRAMARSEASS